MEHFVVIGLGRFGESVAKYLYKKNKEVMVIDNDKSKIQKIEQDVTHAVQADSTDIRVLRDLGIQEFEVAVVSIGGDIHANVLTTLNVKELGVPYVIAKAKTESDRKLLTKIGADRVVNPEEDMGRKLSFDVVHTNVFDYIEFAQNGSLIEISASPALIGKTLSELSWNEVEVNIIAIKRQDNLDLNPGAQEEIREDDILLVIGENEDLERLQQKMLK